MFKQAINKIDLSAYCTSRHLLNPMITNEMTIKSKFKKAKK